MTIRLYDLAAADPAIRFSPFCWRTRMALLHKGLAFDAVPWRFTEKDTLGPSGQDRVPVIVENGRWISDSWTIAVYLDEAYPDRPPLMKDRAARVMAKFAATWAAAAIHPATVPIVLTHIQKNLTPADQTYFRQSREARFGKTLEDLVVPADKGVAALRAALVPLEHALGEGDYLGGEVPNYADYAVFGSLAWAWTTSPVDPIDGGSATGRWFNRLLDRFDGHARRMPTMRTSR